MADTKVSALTPLTGANVVPTADVLLIVDTSATTDKKILVSELSLAQNINGTEIDLSSGSPTTADFTIPAWATRVTVMGKAVSSNGTSALIVQLGDSGGIETGSYAGANINELGTVTAYSSGYMLANVMNAGNAYEFVLELTLENASSFTWMGQSSMSNSNSASKFFSSCGRKSTSAAMTTVRLTTVNGTDAFDAGAVNVLYS